jgi:dTMP kinase
MDEQSAEFYRRVRAGYEILARREPERFRVVDGRRQPESVAADVWRAVEPILGAGDD